MFERKPIQRLYKKLVALYPQKFRERFGESMEQTFDDLCRERKQSARGGFFGFALWTFGETFAGSVRENFIEMRRGAIMENIISNGKSAAGFGFLLAMPLAILLLITVFDVEPISGFYKTLTTKADGHSINALGRILEIGALLLLLTGFIISFMPIVRNARAGYNFTAAANPLNLLIAAGLFIFIAALVTGFVVDQYPCWIGVPICD